MAVYVQGFDEERFASTVDRNFFCLICLCVLRDPVLCPRNHHCFCRACITRHLENSRRCPTCADNLTVRTLTRPPRMVKDYLNELEIHCVYIDRGCQEIVQLQHLERHETSCGFMPVVCSNQGCDVTVNQRDLIHHESEVCEFRKVKCHSCEEMSRTLAEMERRVGKIERNLAVIEKNVTKKVSDMDKSVATNLKNMERNVTANIERNVGTKVSEMERNVAANIKKMEKNVTASMERNVVTKVSEMEKTLATSMKNIERNVTRLKTAMVEDFDEIKDVLVKVDDKIEENQRK